jgi:hypothetical protein
LWLKLRILSKTVISKIPLNDSIMFSSLFYLTTVVWHFPPVLCCSRELTVERTAVIA